jgi:uncharacterized lipoprotein YajG
MSDFDPIKDAEQILRTLENEILERLQVTERSADAPQMNSAVGRLTYIDAYQQQQVALHGRRKLESQRVAIRFTLQRVQEGTCTSRGHR